MPGVAFAGLGVPYTVLNNIPGDRSSAHRPRGSYVRLTCRKRPRSRSATHNMVSSGDSIAFSYSQSMLCATAASSRDPLWSAIYNILFSSSSKVTEVQATREIKRRRDAYCTLASDEVNRKLTQKIVGPEEEEISKSRMQEVSIDVDTQGASEAKEDIIEQSIWNKEEGFADSFHEPHVDQGDAPSKEALKGSSSKDPRRRADGEFYSTMLYGNGKDRQRFLDLLRHGEATVHEGELELVMVDFSRHRRYKEALELVRHFKSESVRKALKPTVKAYSIMIDICGKQRLLKSANELFYQMQREGLAPNIVTYNSLIAACARLRKKNEAFELFEEMKVVGIIPDMPTYGSLAWACANAGDVEGAFGVSRMMEELHIRKDLIVYVALLDACAKKKRLEDAFELFRDMKSEGVWPNHVVFVILMKLCAEKHQPQMAFELLTELREWNLVPDVMIYTSLIDACGRVGWPQRAQMVFSFMQDLGTRPNRNSYHALVEAWTRSKKLDRAFEILSEMESAVGLWQDIHIFHVVAEACRANENTALAAKLWQKMKRNKVTPVKRHLPFFISICAQEGCMEEAVELARKACDTLTSMPNETDEQTAEALRSAVQNLWNQISSDRSAISDEAFRKIDVIRRNCGQEHSNLGAIVSNRSTAAPPSPGLGKVC